MSNDTLKAAELNINGGENAISFSDENIVEATRNFKSVEDLGTAYVNATKLLSQKISGVSKDDDFESFSKKAQLFNHLPENKDEYASGSEIPDEIKEIGFKYKLHPDLQLPHLVKDLEKVKQNANEVLKKKEIEKWSEESKEVLKNIEDKDMVLARAFKALDMDREGFEKQAGPLSKHPLVNKMLSVIGNVKEESPADKVGLPDNKTDLSSIKERKAFVLSHLNDAASPYYNEKHPEHHNLKEKLDKAISEVTDYEHKKGKIL